MTDSIQSYSCPHNYPHRFLSIQSKYFKMWKSVITELLKSKMFFSDARSWLLNSFCCIFPFHRTPPPFLYSASVYSPPPLLCCWVLSPCYILFTLIKTLSFAGTQSAWVSLTHLTMVTVQSPVYILASTHRPLSFHSCEGHRWRKEGGGEGRYQINPLGPAYRLRHITTAGHKGTPHHYNWHLIWVYVQCTCF